MSRPGRPLSCLGGRTEVYRSTWQSGELRANRIAWAGDFRDDSLWSTLSAHASCRQAESPADESHPELETTLPGPSDRLVNRRRDPAAGNDFRAFPPWGLLAQRPAWHRSAARSARARPRVRWCDVAEDALS